MNKYIPWILGAAAILVMYYAIAMPGVGTADVALSAINNSGISGSATLAEENGTVVVTLTIAGAMTPMPAHVHEGSCPGVGAVKYPLEPVVNGTSRTVLSGTTLAAMKASLPLAINIHKSAAEANIYVACGSVNL